MTVATPRVWHVSGPGLDSTSDVAGRASERGWEVIVVPCVRLTSGGGRTLDTLERGDAIQLYEDMHRRPVAVVYEGNPRVRLDPRPPVRADRTISLYQFCWYKSFAVSLRSGVAARWDSAFAEWLAGIECDGPNDPRILPFHIFAAKKGFDLDDMFARRQFQRVHRRCGGLVDDRKRLWKSARPGTRHGREPQTVRGLRLADGFHWDVATSHSPFLMSSNETWRVKSGGYINVYPDGHTRVGTHCRQTWTAKDSRQADKQDRELSRRKR